jgi:hypothetical protein
MKKQVALVLCSTICIALNVLGCTKQSPSISCDESKWERAKAFDANAWKEKKNREQFADLLVTDLKGLTREKVEEVLGIADNRIQGSTKQPSTYNYFLGYTDSYFGCDGALSIWLIVEFDIYDKVQRLRLHREH